jgi:hypothetical protein
MPPELNRVSEEAVKTVNFIKTCALKFKKVCLSERGGTIDHRQLLLHTDVRLILN